MRSPYWADLTRGLSSVWLVVPLRTEDAICLSCLVLIWSCTARGTICTSWIKENIHWMDVLGPTVPYGLMNLQFTAYKNFFYLWTVYLYLLSRNSVEIMSTLQFFRQFITDVVLSLSSDFLLNTLTDVGKLSMKNPQTIQFWHVN